MTEAEWERCADLEKMLAFLTGRAGERKLRLFACGCCRRIWPAISAKHGRHAVEVAERYADGATKEGKLRAAHNALKMHAYAGDAAAQAASDPQLRWTVFEAASYASSVAGDRPVWNDEQRAQADMLRCIIGNPFRPPPAVQPAWLAWEGGTVARLAAAIYEERAFERMPVLGDSLEDAGCDCEDILLHCRQQGRHHVRGCWVVDLLLGKS